MLFNSFEFLLFLPIVFLLYWYVFRKRYGQNLLIVLASYVFYGWWDWRMGTFTMRSTFGKNALTNCLWKACNYSYLCTDERN